MNHRTRVCLGLSSAAMLSAWLLAGCLSFERRTYHRYEGPREERRSEPREDDDDYRMESQGEMVSPGKMIVE